MGARREDNYGFQQEGTEPLALCCMGSGSSFGCIYENKNINSCTETPLPREAHSLTPDSLYCAPSLPDLGWLPRCMASYVLLKGSHDGLRLLFQQQHLCLPVPMKVSPGFFTPALFAHLPAQPLGILRWLPGGTSYHLSTNWPFC